MQTSGHADVSLRVFVRAARYWKLAGFTQRGAGVNHIMCMPDRWQTDVAVMFFLAPGTRPRARWFIETQHLHCILSGGAILVMVGTLHIHGNINQILL